MENGLNFFISFVEAHRFIGYVILLVGMLLEGETILIGAGILVHLKALDPFDTFAIALSGVIMGDLLWYYFGVYLCSRYGNNKFIDYVKKKKADVIIKGLRAVSDFEHELQMSLMNRRLDTHIETVFMMPSEEYSFLSSKVLKEVASLKGDIRGMVPPAVVEGLKRKFKNRKIK